MKKHTDKTHEFLDDIKSHRAWDPSRHGVMRIRSDQIKLTGRGARKACRRTGYALVITPQHFYAQFFGVS